MNNNILISIKPAHAVKILEGSKKFEYRKVLPKQPVDKVVIYASRPVARVIAEFTASSLFAGSPSELWRMTGEDSGLTHNEFFEYYGDCQQGFAIGIKDLCIYPCAKKLRDVGLKAPQSFQYLSERQHQMMITP
jgi:predicted transcriptional regulator